MERPAQLLSYRQARRLRPKAFVYGFPLDEAGIVYCGEKIDPLPSDLSGEALEIAELKQSQKILHHLIAECEAVWPSDRLKSVLGYRDGKHYTLIAFAACNRPHLNQFIPHDDAMTKLKAIMASNGFKEEPRWFVMN